MTLTDYALRLQAIHANLQALPPLGDVATEAEPTPAERLAIDALGETIEGVRTVLAAGLARAREALAGGSR